ncbi:hypothetical protein [Coleofasciculus sp. FACHB-1120]|uniref:hypothetical protein n=1 Tax=Coleofasciculus sp. FACHB-1120 TaxID=2692783 RepID=UPI001685EF0E|nr:hypothetical protein [Coleofasciculus sp. FACHB-1120]MBD2741961.1 hypothetical protein [Coleofasciculus sp. FACHB-1120]
MAKNGGRGRIRVFFAEVEGDDETIQEGLQAINVAANKIFQSSPKIVKILPASATPLDEDELIEELDSEIDSEDEQDNQLLPGVTANSKPKKSSSKPPIMSIVKDLNLRPEDKLSFRDFYAQKQPSTQEQAITIAVYYLKRVLELDKVTPEHVFTCFKDVERKTPKHMPQSIRDTAKRRGWVDTSERGSIKITNHGENVVEHDLPASNGKKSS